MNTTKPTLLSIRQQAGISAQQLAEEASVSLTEAYLVEIGGFVQTETAQKVLTAFSRLAGSTYTLDDIRLQNVPVFVPTTVRLYDLPTTKQPVRR